MRAMIILLAVLMLVNQQQRVPVVELTVNGRTAHFIVDTGSEQTLVATELTTAAAPSRSEFRRDGGLDVHGRWWLVDLAVGDQRWTKRMVGVVDFANIRAHFGKDIDGLLGQDVLREFESVRIDYRTKVMTLEK